MQADMVADAERVGIQDSLICIPNQFVVRNAPRLVTNDAFAMLASAFGAIPIAMETKRDWRRVHDIVSVQAAQ
jgi:hypothetical protein